MQRLHNASGPIRKSVQIEVYQRPMGAFMGAIVGATDKTALLELWVGSLESTDRFRFPVGTSINRIGDRPHRGGDTSISHLDECDIDCKGTPSSRGQRSRSANSGSCKIYRTDSVGCGQSTGRFGVILAHLSCPPGRFFCAPVATDLNSENRKKTHN